MGVWYSRIHHVLLVCKYTIVYVRSLLTYIFILLSICDDNANRRHTIGAVLFHGGPHTVFQEFQKHVRNVTGNVWEVQVCATVNSNLGCFGIEERHFEFWSSGMYTGWSQVNSYFRSIAMRSSAHVGGICNNLLGNVVRRRFLRNQAYEVRISVGLTQSQILPHQLYLLTIGNKICILRTVW